MSCRNEKHCSRGIQYYLISSGKDSKLTEGALDYWIMLDDPSRL